MGILSVPSVIFNLFFVAFGFQGFGTIRLIIELLEIMFFIEIVQNFLTSYKDQETFEAVIQVKRIAINYILNGNFILHILAAFPYQLLTQGDSDPEEHILRNWLMLKMLRLARVSTDFIQDDVLLSLTQQLYKPESRDDKIANDRFIINVIKIIKQVLTTLVATYILALMWYRFSDYW
jgi:pyoverdine/dityrosine biosynthesis protein Dit1